MTPAPAPAPSPDWCLFLDVDGTLIALTGTPFETRAGNDLKTLLDVVAQRLDGALALVSGRSIDHLDEMFAPLRLPCAGLHGVERRTATGALHGASFADAHLDRARAALRDLVQSHPGTLLEDKGRTIAVHFRLAPQFEPQVRERVAVVAGILGEDYHVQPGSMMFEIKPRGFNKGRAVHAFMREPPFSGRTPVYLGDDLTDIDGFKEVEAHGGLAIAVGPRVHAGHGLEDPAAVFRWLEGFAALAR